MNDMIERVATAMYTALTSRAMEMRPGAPFKTWEELPEEQRDMQREAARAGIAAMGDLERLCHALERIRDHQCTAYDHPLCNNEMYRGSYGIGIVDGHRAAAAIAREALASTGGAQ